jgi:hypothetical protein
MTNEEAHILSIKLGQRRCAGSGKILSARIDAAGGWILFEGGATGDHSLSINVSDEKRIRAHWEGYCRNNGAIPPIPGATVRAHIGGIWRWVRVVRSTERRVKVAFRYKYQDGRGPVSERWFPINEVQW